MSVRVTKVPDSGAKRTMLDAAERLVADKGFASVSIRDITGAAKANVAAVNYHFGNREGLMDLVMTRLLEPLCSARLDALDSAERRGAGKMVPVEETVGIYVRALEPLAAQLEIDAGLFFPLAGRILVLPDDALPPSLAAMRGQVSARFLEALSRAMPVAEAEGLAASWSFFEAGLGQSLLTANASGLMEQWICFGARGIGESAGSAGIERKDDPQGLLFDF